MFPLASSRSALAKLSKCAMTVRGAADVVRVGARCARIERAIGAPGVAKDRGRRGPRLRARGREVHQDAARFGPSAPLVDITGIDGGVEVDGDVVDLRGDVGKRQGERRAG